MILKNILCRQEIEHLIISILKILTSNAKSDYLAFGQWQVLVKEFFPDSDFFSNTSPLVYIDYASAASLIHIPTYKSNIEYLLKGLDAMVIWIQEIITRFHSKSTFAINCQSLVELIVKKSIQFKRIYNLVYKQTGLHEYSQYSLEKLKVMPIFEK